MDSILVEVKAKAHRRGAEIEAIRRRPAPFTSGRHSGTLAHGIVIALDLGSERHATRKAHVQIEDAPRTSNAHRD
jgi:hypothetical protein